MTATLAPPRPHARHVLLDVGLVLAQLSAFASGLVIWVFSGLTFFGEPLGRADYLNMAIGFGVTAALLAVSTLLAFVVHARVWVPLAGIALATVSAGSAVVSLLEALERPAEASDGESWWWPLQLFVFLPTSWPLIVVCLGTVIVGSAARRG
jgi:hypothetical protein